MSVLSFSPGLLANSVNNGNPIRKQSSEYLISAQGKDKNNFSVTSVNTNTHRTRSALSGFRGHGLAQNPAKTDSVIMFARRPGTVAIEINLASGNTTRIFKLEKNRNLQGHGCFSADGKLLFTAEADSKTGEGKIVVRDTKDFKLLTEIGSYGIGPHEIKLLPDGKTLVVANGGILTRPITGRKKLNLQTMASNLTYIDLYTGNKLDSFQVPEEKASIRHIDVAKDGTVTLAMQLQREATNHQKIVPLSAIHKPGERIQLLDEPSILIEKMHDYMGSVAINNKSRTAGFTSPKGNLAAFWNIDTAEFSGYHQLNDVCGLCVSPDEKTFVISNSFGEIRHLDAFTLKENKAERLHFSDTHWDNHMINATVNTTLNPTISITINNPTKKNISNQKSVTF